MQFTKLQAQHGSGMSWKLVRESRKGNLVMFGEKITGCDEHSGGRWPSPGWAYALYLTAIVHPNTGEVLALDVHEDDWPY